MNTYKEETPTMIDPEYRIWSDLHVRADADNDAEWCDIMASAYPELERTAAILYTGNDAYRVYVCVDGDGQVVDPFVAIRNGLYDTDPAPDDWHDTTPWSLAFTGPTQ